MEKEIYEYKLTGTLPNGKRFKTMKGNGNYLNGINIYKGHLWERVNGGAWKIVKTVYN